MLLCEFKFPGNLGLGVTVSFFFQVYYRIINLSSL